MKVAALSRALPIHSLTTDHIGVVMEQVDNGALDAIIADASIALGWDTMLQLLTDAAQALTYLSGISPPVIHPVRRFLFASSCSSMTCHTRSHSQDLRSSRLLVDRNWRVKLSDYVFVNLELAMLGRPMPPNAWFDKLASWQTVL